MAQGLDQANSPSSLSKVDLSCPVVPKTAVDLELEANIVHTWDVAPADLDKNDIAAGRGAGPPSCPVAARAICPVSRKVGRLGGRRAGGLQCGGAVTFWSRHHA
eukprot:1179293-Prorocentrum_minimum.AAC.4